MLKLSTKTDRWNIGIFNANCLTKKVIALGHVVYLGLVGRTELKWTLMDWTHVPQNGVRTGRFKHRNELSSSKKRREFLV